MHRRLLLLVLALCLAGPHAAAAEGQTELIWSLRTGYDANPRGDKASRGSPLLGYGLTLDHQRLFDDQVVKLGVGAQSDYYAPSAAEPSALYRLSAEHAAKLSDAVDHRVVLTAVHEDDDATRRNSLGLRERLEAKSGRLRLFALAESRLSSLNERNVLLGSDFLDEPQPFWINTLTPGVALAEGDNQAGVSVALSRVDYLETSDYLGLRKDQERVQPFFFWAFKLKDLKVEGSISQALVAWPDKDFSGLSKFLYGVEASLPVGAFIVSGSSSRTIEDTTFPTASLALVTNHEARATWKPDEANALSVFWRQQRRTYLEVDVSTRANVLGADYARKIAPDRALTLTAFYKEGTTAGIAPIRSFAALVGLQQSLSWK